MSRRSRLCSLRIPKTGLSMSMQKNRPRQLTWIPWIAAAAVASLVFTGWYVLHRQEDARFRNMTAAAARLSEVLIRRDLAGHVSALQSLAHRWENAPGAARADREADVANYIATQPGYQAIEWADTSMHVRWMVPLRAKEAAQDFAIGSIPDALRAARQAQTTHQTVLTPPLELVQGDSVLAVYQPLIPNDQFAGLMVGIIRLIPWLDTVLMREDESSYYVGISIDNIPVYGPPAETNLPDTSWQEERALSLYGLDWIVRVTPAAEYLPAMYSRLSTAVLALGLILSALLGWIVHSALNAKLQTQRLQSSTRRLTTLLRNLPGMAYRFANQENWPAEFVSEACGELCGYSKSEFEEHRVFWSNLLHPDDRAAFWCSVQKAIDNGRAFESEYRIITRDGQERWMLSRGRLNRAKNDETAFLEGLTTDITSQKHAAAALVTAEAYAKAVVDTAAEAVITIDASGRIETFNRAAQQMFRYTFEEIAGQHIRMLMPEPHRAEHDQYIDRLLERNPSDISGTGRDVTGQRKDGSLFPISLSVSEVPNQSERKLVGLIRDLSEQRAAEQEAREHRERLAHVDRLNMLGEMATGIAHEINQPLSAISMYAQSGIRFLAGATPKPERVRDALDKLSMQAHRAGAIIERMQQLGKQRESRRESIDCNALIKEVHNLAETEARIRDVLIDLELCVGPQRIVCDPVQIQQVALNLLRNGMESMVSSGCRHGNRIVLRTQCGDGRFTVFVVDSGMGVSNEVAERLYQPFSTTKSTGMGLGLSICRSIISAHGGQLGFTNNEQGGSTFFFSLPFPT